MFLFFILGFISGTIFFEPIIINFVYMSNPGLFLDIILTEKNRQKLFDELLFERSWEDCE